MWLDYTNGAEYWADQVSWAAGLNGVLTYNTPGYTVDFGTGRWWVPETVDGPLVSGF